MLLVLSVLVLTVFVLPNVIDRPTAALVGLSSTTIIIMTWQALREAGEVVVMPDVTIRGVPPGAGSQAFEAPISSNRRSRIFFYGLPRRFSIRDEKFSPMDHYAATFDIGNVGLHDVVVHEYVVVKEEPLPLETITGSIPCFDDRRERKGLRCGERITGMFALKMIDGHLTAFRIDVHSAGRKASRRLYALKIGDRLQYFDTAVRTGIRCERMEKVLRSNPSVVIGGASCVS